MVFYESLAKNQMHRIKKRGVIRSKNMRLSDYYHCLYLTSTVPVIQGWREQ